MLWPRGRRTPAEAAGTGPAAVGMRGLARLGRGRSCPRVGAGGGCVTWARTGAGGGWGGLGGLGRGGAGPGGGGGGGGLAGGGTVAAGGGDFRPAGGTVAGGGCDLPPPAGRTGGGGGAGVRGALGAGVPARAPS